MRRKVDSTIQDYKKLIAVMEFQYPNGISFCKEAAMMFFSNTRHEGILKGMLKSVRISDRVAFFSIIHYD